LNITHATIVLAGLILIALAASPLIVLVDEALNNPDLLTVSVKPLNNSLAITLNYNGSVKLRNVILTVSLETPEGLVSKSAGVEELSRGDNLTVVIRGEQIGDLNNVSLAELKLQGKVSGIYPFEISYKPSGGGG
jgi:hypothetical protein